MSSSSVSSATTAPEAGRDGHSDTGHVAPGSRSDAAQPTSRKAAAGVRELFGSLASHLSGSDRSVVGFVRLGGSPESAALLEELAVLTVDETGKSVLVVTVSSPSSSDTLNSESEWPLYAVSGRGAEPRWLGSVAGDDRSTVSALQAVLSTHRAAMQLSQVPADHAFLPVPPDCFRGRSPGVPPAVRQLLLAARTVFDLVLVDLPESTESVHALVDGVALVMRPDEAIEDVTTTAQRVAHHGGAVLGVVVSAVPGRPEQRSDTGVGPHRKARPTLQAVGVAAVLCLAVVGGVVLVQSARSVNPTGGAFPEIEPLLSTEVVVSGGLATAPTVVGTGLATGDSAVGPRPGGNRAAARSRDVPSAIVAPPANPVSEARPSEPSRPSTLDLREVSSQSETEAVGVAATTRDGSPTPPEDLGDVPLAGRDGVTEPERLPEFDVRPQYATMAGLGPVEAEVFLSAVVRSDGTVDDVRLLQLNGGPPDVVEPAIEAVRQWRYRPATRDGRQVDARITVLVDFRTSS